MKSFFWLFALLALLATQGLAQGKAQTAEPSVDGNRSSTRQSPSDSKAAKPEPGQGGPAVHPNPQIVPPRGAEAGISPEAGQPQELAPASSSDSQLRSSIAKALKNEPTLDNAQLEVAVGGNTITIQGTVASGKERLAATRIAESFAGDRKVEDKINIVGQNQPAPESQPAR